MRKTYFDFDKEVVDAVDNALEVCQVGDIPDITLAIISNLKMDGFEIVKMGKKLPEFSTGDLIQYRFEYDVQTGVIISYNEEDKYYLFLASDGYQHFLRPDDEDDIRNVVVLNKNIFFDS